MKTFYVHQPYVCSKKNWHKDLDKVALNELSDDELFEEYEIRRHKDEQSVSEFILENMSSNYEDYTADEFADFPYDSLCALENMKNGKKIKLNKYEIYRKDTNE